MHHFINFNQISCDTSLPSSVFCHSVVARVVDVK